MAPTKLTVLLSIPLLLIAGLTTRTTHARPVASAASEPLYRSMPTKHEGVQRYRKHWNFWVRIGGDVQADTKRIWRDYDSAGKDLDALLRDVGAPRTKVATEEEFWRRIGLVWSWWQRKVRVDNQAFGTIKSARDGWPSAPDYGRYYNKHGKLVCAACFSKAHLFATVLGRVAYPRERITIAYAHHTEAGAPKTASHVYVAVYVAGRWYYIDPTHAWATAFPTFAKRRSLGPPKPNSVDYTHPFKITPVPGSRLAHVPYLGD